MRSRLFTKCLRALSSLGGHLVPAADAVVFDAIALDGVAVITNPVSLRFR